MTERIGQMMRTIEQGGRLAVVGEMAAHMAHEVRTPLSSIKMNLQLLKRDADRGLVPGDVRVSIDTSLSEIARLESIVTRTLEFGAPERAAPSRCRLHDVIQEGTDLLRAAFEQRGIEMRLDLGAESDWILADRGRIKGVFLNLLVNARDAMPAGGEITVETQLFLGDRGRQMLAAAVSDTGAGVPVALREQVFHPFFTTKADGCGIGLPGSLRTLRAEGGDLFLSDRPDGSSGACFVVVLPLALSRVEEVGVRSAAGAVRGPIFEPRWRAPAAGPRWRPLEQPTAAPDVTWAAMDARAVH
jgi:signal transduction histidine kinase